jgi:glycosyltransferase 2 family protein
MTADRETLRLSPARARRALRRLVCATTRLVSSPARRWCVGAVAVAALAALLAAHADLARMSRSFLQADWRWLAAALGLMLASLLLRSVALKVIVDALGGVRARVGDTFSATSIGLLANSVIPIRVGTVLSPYALYVLLRRRGAAVPFATTLGMALTERLFAVATFVVLALTFVSALSVPTWAVEVLIASAVFAAVFIVGGIVLERRRRVRGARDTDHDPTQGTGAQASRDDAAPDATPDGARDSRRDRLRRQWPALLDSQRIMGKPWSALLVATVQAVAWLVQLGAAWAALQAFHLGGAGLRGAALVLILTNLIGLVPLTPGNVGTFQAAALAALAVSGVGAGPAMAYALGLQAMQLVVGAIAGLASLSLQDLTLADLRGKSHQAAALLYHGEPPTPQMEGPLRP